MCHCLPPCLHSRNDTKPTHEQRKFTGL
uniref:Uncharacterized protein n=1 Tax=Arundo donax TaxID=35708 RepID=A0A0A8YTM0_ARUDO